MNQPSPAPLLDVLQSRGLIDAVQRSALHGRPRTPWWLAILLALAAWVASLFILAAFLGPLLALADGMAPRAVGGLALIGLSLALFRRRGAFTDQMALAFSLAGQGLVASVMTEIFPHELEPAAVVALLVATAMLLAPSSLLHRALCGLTALGSLAYLIGPGNGLALFGVAVTAMAVGLWLMRVQWAGTAQAAVFKAVAHAATLAALTLAPYGNARSGFAAVADVLAASQPSLVPALYAGGLIVVLAAAAAWLTRREPMPTRATALAAALLFGAATHGAPGLIAGAAILLAAFHACHRPWVVMTLFMLLLYLGEYYYSLQATLLAKSLVLVACGLVLLGLRHGLRFAARRPT